MKKLVYLLYVLTIATSLPINDDNDESDDLGWFMPQLNGSSKWMSAAELRNLPHEFASQCDDARIKFYLYTRDSTEQEILTGDCISLGNSKFNVENPTRIIIHGWLDNKDSKVNVNLRSAFLASGTFNVISVDWSLLGGTLIYPIAVSYVEHAGKNVASFIDFLHIGAGMSFDSLLVVGHSLGAHVAGFAGKHVEKGKIFQITGLDPAGPGFSYSNPNGRLSSTDALYVESIQTAIGRSGFKKPIGKAAFYPNGGVVQPGCDFDLLGVCDHLRSFKYYAEAIRKNNFPAIRCSNYRAALLGLCGSTYSGIKMGAPNNYAVADGVFYVPVNGRPPYGME